MKRKIIAFVAVAFLAGLLIAQVPGKHLSFNQDRYWANSGVLSTDSRVESRGTSNGFRAQYQEGTYATIAAGSAGTLDITRVNAGTSAGTLKVFTYQNDSLADDGTVNLPDATSGIVFVSAGAETIWAVVAADGSCVKGGGSTDTDVADTDAKLDVYDGGTYAVAKNRLGAAKETRIVYFYN